MVKYALYTGCTIPYRLNAYEASTRRVMERLGVELIDLEKANCCGLYVEPASKLAYLTLAGRVLALAEDQGLDILCLCGGCTSALAKANSYLKEHEDARNEVNAVLADFDMEFKGKTRVVNSVNSFIEDIGLREIQRHITRPFNGLKLAAHYGCHLLKPSDVLQFEDPEAPKSVDNLCVLTGATMIDYKDKYDCCGAPSIATEQSLSVKIINKKLMNITSAGADAVVTVCPYCELMFDLMQLEAEDVYQTKYGLPALLHTQLLGLSMDMDFEELGMSMNKVSAEKIMDYLSD
ncbi:MAG: CoB--CoM heterodisulfide reductase iron-sulfur subunit B family protein [Promethearchaeota archaeon]